MWPWLVGGEYMSQVNLGGGCNWCWCITGTEIEDIRPEGEEGWVIRFGGGSEGEEPEASDGHLFSLVLLFLFLLFLYPFVFHLFVK